MGLDIDLVRMTKNKERITFCWVNGRMGFAYLDLNKISKGEYDYGVGIYRLTEDDCNILIQQTLDNMDISWMEDVYLDNFSMDDISDCACSNHIAFLNGLVIAREFIKRGYIVELEYSA